MDEQFSKPKTRTFTLFVLVSLVLLTGAAAWLGYRVENLTDDVEQVKTAAAKKSEDIVVDRHDNGWNTRVTSGKGAFEITFPDGWGPLIKETGADSFILAGTKQPDVTVGEKVKITEVEGAGSDSLSLFSVILLPSGGFAPPMGEANEFTIGKAEDAIVGKKYTHIYTQDEFIGIGHLRLQGDRDYEYVFNVGGKELRVFYSVHGSDPRNQIELVDEIVRTITLPGKE
jgi:hypothetical protein